MIEPSQQTGITDAATESVTTSFAAIDAMAGSERTRLIVIEDTLELRCRLTTPPSTDTAQAKASLEPRG